MKVEGYVFDFGGVISVSPMPKWDDTFFPYCRSIGLDPQFVRNGFKRYRRLWDGDFISFAEMYSRIFADAGLPPPTAEQLAVIERLDKFSWVNELREDTYELMRGLKAAGFKLGILSNMSSDFHRDCFATRCARYRELAEVEVISGFERLYKPDPKIYAVTAERMGIEPAKLMFYDDFMENVEGARACGWQSQLYPAQLPHRLLVLASGSPRRAKILREAGAEFMVMKSDAPEVTYPDDPERTVRENALAKQRVRFADGAAPQHTLSADTIVWFQNRIYGKPRTLDEAKEFLRELSGQVHCVFTGVAYDGEVRVERSEVRFQPLTEAVIDEYVARVHPLDRAGAYDIDESGNLIVASYQGSYENIMGLPLEPLKHWGLVK